MNTSHLAISANLGGALQSKRSARHTTVDSSSSVRSPLLGDGLRKLILIGFCFLSASQGFSAPAVSLAWIANPEPDVTGYRLDYGTVSGAYPNTINVGTNPSTSVAGLTEGATYYFVVSAINTAGQASLPSSEVSYKVATINQAPVASPMAVSTVKATPLAIVLGGSDPEGSALSFAIVSSPANGVLSGTAPNLNYTPAASFIGSDSFTFLVNDGSLNSNVATVSISVKAPVLGGLVNGSFESGFTGWTVTGNAFIESAVWPYTSTDGVKLASLNGDRTSDSPPNAVLSQAFATTAGATYTLTFDMGLIGSASGEQQLQVTADGAGNVLSKIASKSKVAGGAVQWAPNSYAFVANSTTTTLTFRDVSAVTDGIDTLLDNVRVTESPASLNTAPVAVADSYSTNAGTALVVPAAGVLANDSDAQSDPLTAVLDAGPSRGSLTLNSNGGFYYTPAGGFSGTDSFTYHANDGLLNSAIVTVSITVIQVNRAPVANSMAMTTAEDTSLAVVLGGSDLDGDTLSFTVLTKPAQGTLTGIAPNLTYIPAENFNGSDQFTFRVNDGTVNSAPATVSITVTPVNDAPLATAQSVTTAEDNQVSITLGGTDVDGDSLSFTVLTKPAKGMLTGIAPNLIYIPAENFNGSDQFTFRVNDGTVNSAPATVSITVTPVNDAPVAVSKSVTTDKNVALPITLAGTDVEGDPLTFTILSGPSNGTLSGTAPNLTYLPALGFNGSDAITFRVNDGQANSAPGIISITVNAVNDIPVALSQSVTTAEDSPLPITLTGTDGEASPLTFTVVVGPTHGTLVGTAPNLTYQPVENFNGSDEFRFRVNDGTADSVLATVSITVTPVNDAPFAISMSLTTVAGAPLPFTLGGTDPDADSLTFTIVSGPSRGTLAGTAPNLTYSPEANYTGADQFTFRVNDGTVDSATATVSITVTAVNSAPAFAIKPLVYPAGNEKEAYVGQSLASTAIDPDAGDIITYSKVDGPAWLVIAPSGSLSGTPPGGSAGTNLFTVRATDTSGASDETTLQIKIIGNTLPLPWSMDRVGSGNLAGFANFSSGIYTIAGAGLLADKVDSGNFAWQTLASDGSITARVRQLSNTGASARVGVMIRESLAANSRQIYMGVDGSGNYQWLRRLTTGGSTSKTSKSGSASAAIWVRLDRVGNVVYAYQSTNGTTWTKLGNVTVTLPKNCYIGLWISSGDNGLLNTSQFSNVVITP